MASHRTDELVSAAAILATAAGAGSVGTPKPWRQPEPLQPPRVDAPTAPVASQPAGVFDVEASERLAA
jgi:hypothetical protein